MPPISLYKIGFARIERPPNVARGDVLNSLLYGASRQFILRLRPKRPNGHEPIRAMLRFRMAMRESYTHPTASLLAPLATPGFEGRSQSSSTATGTERERVVPHRRPPRSASSRAWRECLAGGRIMVAGATTRDCWRLSKMWRNSRLDRAQLSNSPF
jgi:hypothetical protein